MSRLGGTFTILCLFMLKVKGEEDPEAMGLAEDAFDDQYLGCRQAMENHLEAQDVLTAEMSSDMHFQRAWNEGEKIWSLKKEGWDGPDLPEGFSDLHGIAVVTYTGFIRERFNKAVKSSGKSYRDYEDRFHFKFLHYYLTVALQLLYKDCGEEVPTTYRGFENVLHQLPNGTTKVKFGHFLHTSSSESMAYEMGNSSFFTVMGCSGVPVDKFSEYPHEEEVVFPGYEIFDVQQVQRYPNEFLLTSTGRWCSNFNCALIQGERPKLSVEDCISSAPSGFVFRCSSASLIALLVAAAVSVAL